MSGACHARDDPLMMLPHDVAAMLEEYALEVEHLPGVSRINPHAFVEAKSELIHKLRLKAREMRTVPVIPKPLPMLRPGAVDVGRRSVQVEVRGGRRRA